MCICREATDHAELLAHEFEHVLEQIEGLDLRRMARERIRRLRDAYAVFETDRAQAAGRIVGQRRAEQRLGD